MRTIVRAGLWTTVVAILALMATVKPDLAGGAFAASMAVLGVGMGLIVSQLGNVVQSSVDASGRGEAGGLQYTGQQLGSSLGVALIGAIVLAGLTGAFISNVETDPRISEEVAAQVSVAVEPGIDFVAADQVEAAAQQAGLDDATSAGHRRRLPAGPAPSLKAGLLAAALLALALPRVHPGPAPRAAPLRPDDGAGGRGGNGLVAKAGRRDPSSCRVRARCTPDARSSARAERRRRTPAIRSRWWPAARG